LIGHAASAQRGKARAGCNDNVPAGIPGPPALGSGIWPLPCAYSWDRYPAMLSAAAEADQGAAGDPHPEIEQQGVHRAQQRDKQGIQ